MYPRGNPCIRFHSPSRLAFWLIVTGKSYFPQATSPGRPANLAISVTSLLGFFDHQPGGVVFQYDVGAVLMPAEHEGRDRIQPLLHPVDLIVDRQATKASAIGALAEHLLSSRPIG